MTEINGIYGQKCIDILKELGIDYNNLLFEFIDNENSDKYKYSPYGGLLGIHINNYLTSINIKYKFYHMYNHEKKIEPIPCLIEENESSNICMDENQSIFYFI